MNSVLPLLCVLASASAVLAQPKLAITEIQYDPISGERGEVQTEWIEIQNVGGQSVSLRGIQITSGTKKDPHEMKQRLVLEERSLSPGEYAVIGVGLSEAYQELQLPSMIAHAGEIKYAWLGNSGDSVALRDEKGQVIDEVVYQTDEPWPRPIPGGSIQLVASDGADPAVANDDPANWIASDSNNGQQFIGHGYGTPGGPPKSDPTTQPTE